MNKKYQIESILVPCTNRKRTHSGKTVYYKNCQGTPKDWLSYIDSNMSNCLPASQVYCGSAWSYIQKAYNLLPNANWSIVSAGYGLIPYNKLITNYQATFQSNTPDSVGKNWSPQSIANIYWWEALAGKYWYKPFLKSQGIVLIQLSSVYLKALEPGLIDLANAIEDKLVIISPGYKNKSPLQKYILPIDTRFEHIIKTPRSDMGAAALNWLLSSYLPEEGWDVKELFSNIERVFNKLPDIQVHNRKTLTDNEILKFIDKHATQLPKPAASPLLRKLRNENFACEQKRFGSLFKNWQSFKRTDLELNA